MIEIEVQLFGVFKKGIPSGVLKIQTSETAEMRQVKRDIGNHLSTLWRNRSELTLLLERSVLADESRILREQDLLENRSHLCLLPPVCGG